MLKNKSVLITGATGLIGSAIVDTLIYANRAKNFDINIFATSRDIDKLRKRFEKYSNDKLLTFVKYDASRDLNFGFKVDYIIHGASNAHPIVYSLEPVEI
jgi:nucleoside-diphosphate-sugar epimerase